MAAEHFGNWALYLDNKWDYVLGKTWTQVWVANLGTLKNLSLQSCWATSIFHQLKESPTFMKTSCIVLVWTSGNQPTKLSNTWYYFSLVTPLGTTFVEGLCCQQSIVVSNPFFGLTVEEHTAARCLWKRIKVLHRLSFARWYVTLQTGCIYIFFPPSFDYSQYGAAPVFDE